MSTGLQQVNFARASSSNHKNSLLSPAYISTHRLQEQSTRLMQRCHYDQQIYQRSMTKHSIVDWSSCILQMSGQRL